MSAIQFDDVFEQAVQLSSAEQARLIERLAGLMRETMISPQPQDTEVWTDEQRAAMLTPEPLSGAEVIAMGLVGTWAEMGIEDGADWVNEQKRKRREKFDW
jgi:hypothetical protein